MAAPLYTTASGQLWHAGKILVVTVGLPARGKTHLSHALERYLRWLGVKTAVISLGDYRRKVLGGPENVPEDYFRPAPRSEATEKLRTEILEGFEQQIWDFFEQDGGQVCIADGNHGTQARRAAIREKFGPIAKILFLESICDDQSIVDANVRSVKISSPDYKNWDAEKAVEDFYNRIKGHEKFYEPIEAPSFPYVKVINVGQQIRVNNVSGYLQSRMVFHLMNIHTSPRTIYFARAGEALVEHLYKADADLSSLGWKYAECLADFVEDLRNKNKGRRMRIRESVQKGDIQPQREQEEGEDQADVKDWQEIQVREQELRGMQMGLQPAPGPGEAGRPLEIWTSARRRSSHTAYPFSQRGYRVIERSQLSEMNPGIVDGMSQEEIQRRFPDEWEKKLSEPYSHRFPRAESYHDLSVRIEPIIFELERATCDVLIIGQSSILRCLRAYLQGSKPHEIPSIPVHEGELVDISPQAYGVQVRTHRFWDPEEQRRIRDQEFEKQDNGEEGKSAQSAGDETAVEDEEDDEAHLGAVRDAQVHLP